MLVGLLGISAGIDLTFKYHFVYLENGWYWHMTKFRKSSRVHSEHTHSLQPSSFPFLFFITNTSSLCIDLQKSSVHIWAETVSAPPLNILSPLPLTHQSLLFVNPEFSYLGLFVLTLGAFSTSRNDCRVNVSGSSPQPKTDRKLVNKCPGFLDLWMR